MAENQTPVEHHASKPGLWSYVLMVLGAIGFVLIAYGDSLKRFFGIE